MFNSTDNSDMVCGTCIWKLFFPSIFWAILEAGFVSSNSTSLLNFDRLGSDLYCFECNENYNKKYNPYDSPCRNNLSQVITRQCGKNEIYCRVERLDLYRFDTMLSMSRGCSDQCDYGCRFNGLAITYRKCTSCCTTSACNTDSAAHSIFSWKIYGSWSSLLSSSGIIAMGTVMTST